MRRRHCTLAQMVHIDCHHHQSITRQAQQPHQQDTYKHPLVSSNDIPSMYQNTSLGAAQKTEWIQPKLVAASPLLMLEVQVVDDPR